MQQNFRRHWTGPFGAGVGPTMSDGKALFHSDHSNLAGSGAAIGDTTLSAARLALRTMKGLDGETLIEVSPKYLVVPAAQETLAEKYLAIIAPAQATNVNVFSGKLELIVEPRLDTTTSAGMFSAIRRWRRFSNTRTWPTPPGRRWSRGRVGKFSDWRSARCWTSARARWIIAAHSPIRARKFFEFPVPPPPVGWLRGAYSLSARHVLTRAGSFPSAGRPALLEDKPQRKRCGPSKRQSAKVL